MTDIKSVDCQHCNVWLHKRESLQNVYCQRTLFSPYIESIEDIFQIGKCVADAIYMAVKCFDFVVGENGVSQLDIISKRLHTDSPVSLLLSIAGQQKSGSTFPRRQHISHIQLARGGGLKHFFLLLYNNKRKHC